MPGIWRDNVGTFATAFAGGQASFDATTITNPPQIGDWIVGWHVGWQGQPLDGAATSGASTPEDGAFTRLTPVREPGDNHILQAYVSNGPIASTGHRTLTFATIDPGNAGIWAGGVFSIGGLLSSGALDVNVPRNNQAPGSPVVTASSGTLAQADEFALAFMYPVDTVGQTITAEGAPWIEVAQRTAAEPYGVMRSDRSDASAFTGQWALGSGGSGTFNPLALLLTFKVAAGGGGGGALRQKRLGRSPVGVRGVRVY